MAQARIPHAREAPTPRTQDPRPHGRTPPRPSPLPRPTRTATAGLVAGVNPPLGKFRAGQPCSATRWSNSPAFTPSSIAAISAGV